MADPHEHLLDAITTIPSRINTNNPRLIQAQVPTFGGTKDYFNEFEHPLKNNLRPKNHRLPEEVKLQYIQSLLREEAIEFYQSLTVTTEKNLNDVPTKFRKEITKDDLKEVARCKWDQSKYNPTAETFSDLLKHLKVIAKQAFHNLQPHIMDTTIVTLHCKNFAGRRIYFKDIVQYSET